MADPVLAYGVVSGPENLGSGVERPIKLTNRGNQRVAMAEPSRAPWVRDRYAISGGVIANGVAPVADVPTTAAARALYNGNVDGGKSLFVEMITARSASGTLGLGASLMVGLCTTKQAAAVANHTGVVGPRRLTSIGAPDSLATLGGGVTLAAAPAWISVATVQHVAAVSVGAGLTAFLDGLIEVPPGFALGITVHAPVGTTALFLVDVVYSEWIYTVYA